MAGDSGLKIVCSACGVAADAIIKPNDDTAPKRIRCPRCGREADLKQALSEAAKHNLRNAIRGAFSGARGKHISVKRSPNPKPKFILS
jgi:DNA-directed RNA polymerase subunit RPC12/RpoP